MKKSENEFYVCPYCGKEHTSPVDLAHCILSCEELERKKKEAEKKKKLEAEKEARYEKIENAVEEINAMISSYIKDYGKFSFKDSNENGYPLSYLWNKIFF